VSARGSAVLRRFPQHLAASDPGKRFGSVVDALAQELDVVTRQLQDVRTARRIEDGTTRRDLLALASLHALTSPALGLVDRRVDALTAAASEDPIDVEAVAALTGVPQQALEELGPDLASVAVLATRHSSRTDLHRAVILRVVHAHRVGNATPTALLAAAAAYLGLRVDEVTHSPDSWWHLAQCADTLRLVAPAPADPPPEVAPDLSPTEDVLALEENPFRRADVEPSPKRTGQRTRILRGGLDDVSVTVRVVGAGTHTIRPAVVHLETGRGVVYEGDVPDGVELAFGSTGRVTLDGADVTGSAWSFEGALFADAGQVLPGVDFGYADEAGQTPPETTQPASFVVATPLADAFDDDPAFPHGAAAVGPLRLPRGESRWVSFARVARSGGGAGVPTTPRTVAGRFDASAFAAGPDDPVEPCLDLGFGWEEREPFAVRVLLPRRLARLDDDAGSLLREPLRRLLDRHRAAGVTLRVEYADPRWTLGQGVVRSDEEDALGVVVAGTELWPDPDPG